MSEVINIDEIKVKALEVGVHDPYSVALYATLTAFKDHFHKLCADVMLHHEREMEAISGHDAKSQERYVELDEKISNMEAVIKQAVEGLGTQIQLVIETLKEVSEKTSSET